MSNFFFSHGVFKRLVLQTCKSTGLFGKGLTEVHTCIILFFRTNIHIQFENPQNNRKMTYISISVYCACCLAKHDLAGIGNKEKPHFYVNVADIETLESEISYIACK